MKDKKIIWKILFIVGIIPFLTVIFYSVYSSINGFAAFRNSFLLFSIAYWPLYAIGVILIFISIIKIKKK